MADLDGVSRDFMSGDFEVATFNFQSEWQEGATHVIMEKNIPGGENNRYKCSQVGSETCLRNPKRPLCLEQEGFGGERYRMRWAEARQRDYKPPLGDF